MTLQINTMMCGELANRTQVCATQGFSRTYLASRTYPLACAETRSLSTSQLLDNSQPESSCNPTVASLNEGAELGAELNEVVTAT